jgi:NADH-quinone oxidoreductase subunit N
VTTQHVDLLVILPPLVVFGTALLVLVADLFLPGARRTVAMPVAMAGTLAAVGVTAVFAGHQRSTFCTVGTTHPPPCSYVDDRFTVVLQLLVLLSTLVVLLLGRHEVGEQSMPPGEYHFLLLCSVTGMVVLPAARDLLILVVALEVVSLPAFALVGLRRSDPRSGEAALKFFLVSVMTTAVTLLGAALLYGVTGTLQLTEIAQRLADPQTHVPLTNVAVVLTLVGFGFKVSAVPFHFWAPDTYEGAPLPVAAFLSVASKTAGFAGLVVLVFVGYRPYADVWGPVLAGIAAVTMTLGNLVALRQRQAVRLLAWSSVAQAGYILAPLGIAATTEGRFALRGAVAATVAYLTFYAVMNLGAFACVAALARRYPSHRLADYRGLAGRSPWLAIAFAFFLACLAGVPPGVAGLFAKVVVFRALVDGSLAPVIVVMAVNTVIGLYYYLAVAFSLFAAPTPVPSDAADAEAGPAPVPARGVPVLVTAAVAVTAVAAVVLSVYPQVAVHAGDVAGLLGD